MKLDEIAEMLQNGMKQKEIAERLHISQQTVSYRMGLIRTQYPELMQDRGTKTAIPDESPVQTFYQNSECLPKSVQTKVDVYQKTKSTKSEDLVIL
jgi:hypothetical protein